MEEEETAPAMVVAVEVQAAEDLEEATLAAEREAGEMAVGWAGAGWAGADWAAARVVYTAA